MRIQNLLTTSIILTSILLLSCLTRDIQQVEKWGVFEISLNGPDSGNPYLEIDLKAVFKNGNESVTVPGFYDGSGNYKIRFSPPSLGKWSYQTTSNAPELDKKKGAFKCITPAENNNGPLKIVNTFYLQYADGTPFYSVGTTAYQWTSVKQSIQQQTLSTLKEAPFNKIRMCVFPKNYKYGNETEPWMHPFKSEGEKRDFTEPNIEFFQNFDKRIQQLLEMKIQADVILFHPYDENWGYDKMGDEFNNRYVRYMIARISAYRNVWWSLANEWDVPKIKETIDWEGIGTLLHREDPHQRFRGIHNWYNSEDHFYDHNRPWITHTSTQTSQFYNSIRWREMYKKPLLLDEMRYEGDVASSWGNMSGEEMASYFWMGGLSGGYPTHGDTYQNASDDSSEVRWWAKGGLLVGTSPERIAFFRKIMEEAPVYEMTPELICLGDSGNLKTNLYVFSKEGEHYLAYIAENVESIQLKLPDKQEFKIEVLDTWNMTIEEMEGDYNGEVTVPLPDKPYIGIRVTKR